jgi:hypothetical protein
MGGGELRDVGCLASTGHARTTLGLGSQCQEGMPSRLCVTIQCLPTCRLRNSARFIRRRATYLLPYRVTMTLSTDPSINMAPAAWRTSCM